MKTSRFKMFRDGLMKLVFGVALATATFFGNAETPVQQESTALEEKVKTEKYVLLSEWSSCQRTCEGNCPHFDPCLYEFRPWYLDIDKFGNVYIADVLHYSVKKFDMYGNLIKGWDTCGEAGSKLGFPVGIAVDNDFVFVSDLGDQSIQKFDLDGNFITGWDIGSRGVGDLDVDSLGNVYINIVNMLSGQTNFIFTTSIKKFDNNGNFIKEWETADYADTKGFNGLTIDNDDNVYIPGKNKIIKFNSEGYPITEFSIGEDSDQFAPLGLGCDNENNIYASDFGNLCIQKLDSNGNFITRFDSRYPIGIAVNKVGLVYTTHNNPGRIKKFIKQPIVSFADSRIFGKCTLSFESPPSFTHHVFRSPDLKNWEQIDVLKSPDYQNWTDVNKFYSAGKTWIRDPEPLPNTTFYKVSVQEPDFRVVDGIEYCLETDKLSYRRGEKVDLVYRVTNHREEPITIKYNVPYFRLEKDGEIYYASDLDYGYTRYFTLTHSESKEITYQDPNLWKTGEGMGTGRYNLTGELIYRDEGVPVTVTIDVVE